MARSYSMPMGMLWKKMYCSQCGKLLVKKKVSNTYERGDPGFKTFLGGGVVSVFSYTEVTYNYFCSNCRKETTYDEQKEIERVQKKLGRKLVSAEEIPDGSKRREKRARLLVWGYLIVVILLMLLAYWLGCH